jgi:quinolinate synthase
MTIQERIRDLKTAKNAMILAHNYQLPEIQDVADVCGDSLALARTAARLDCEMIVFCGVRFMAETAKLLSPEKKVLMPDYHAICPMAKMIDVETVRELREKYPDAVFVAYVNTTSDVKAEVDLIVTSANALEVINRIPEDKRIVFIPDRNLGSYLKIETGRDIILYEGFCPTHERIVKEDIDLARDKWPGAIVIAHPECRESVLEISDHIAGTSGMINFSRDSEHNEFIIATEQGMLHRLRTEVPDKKFYSPSELNICPNMKKTTIAKLLHSLETETVEVEIPEEIRLPALHSLNSMVA